MSARKLAALAAYLPVFRDPDFVAGRWAGGGEIEPNTFQMPYVSYDEAVTKFVQTVYDEKITKNFDWVKWIKTEEASRLRDDPSFLAGASFDQLSKLLTATIRQDRFVDGALLAACETGLIRGILERAEALRRESPSRQVSRSGKGAASCSGPAHPLSFRFDQALAFASGLHRTQRRKGTDIPYISHLLAVSSLVIENGGDEDAAIGALLHDAAEDQGGEATLALVRQLFGDAVARIVSDCTDSWVEPKPRWRPRKEAYIASLDHKQGASLLVSLADKTHNARAILSDHRLLGETLWSRFSGGRETLWYYQALAEAFGRLLPCRLASEFHDTVDEIVRASG